MGIYFQQPITPDTYYQQLFLSVQPFARHHADTSLSQETQYDLKFPRLRPLWNYILAFLCSSWTLYPHAAAVYSCLGLDATSWGLAARLSTVRHKSTSPGSTSLKPSRITPHSVPKPTVCTYRATPRRFRFVWKLGSDFPIMCLSSNSAGENWDQLFIYLLLCIQGINVSDLYSELTA